MVSEMIRVMLGPWGAQALDFYEAHSLLINVPVLAYGVVLTLAYLNYERIKEHGAHRLQHGPASNATHSSPPLEEGHEAVPWAEIIERVSFFPFVAGRRSLLLRRATPTAVEDLISVSDLAEEAAGAD